MPTIAVRDLRPGHIVIFDDGRLEVVASEFGSGMIAKGEHKTARVKMVTFDNGMVIPVHPSEPVKVL